MPVRRAEDIRYTLGTGLAATGSPVAIRGGEYIFEAEGTAGGSTISLQIQSPNGSWSDAVVWGTAVKSTTLPFAQTGIDLPAGNVRLAATGGAPSGLNGYLIGVG